jgi:lysophospholipase L1-like esterase
VGSRGFGGRRPDHGGTHEIDLNLGRRRALGALVAAALGLAAGVQTAAAQTAPIGDAVVFGDAFATPTFSSTSTWAKQLADRRVLTVVSNRARAGASAVTVGGSLSIRGQVDAYLATRPRLPKFSIIYIGTEDLQRNRSVSAALANIQVAVDSLVRAGANASGRKIVLFQDHDVTYDPFTTTRLRPQVVQFNKGIRRIVAARTGLVTVNLGALLDRVIASPSTFGLTNVTTPNAAASATTALYFDAAHFGNRGHRIIADEVQRVLTAAR